MYWFSDAADSVLYVGKAKSLKNRVQSYTHLTQLSDRIFQLVSKATKLQFRVLNNELEALLVEAELIGTYQPPFNVLLKDDKSPLYIHLSKDTYPEVTTIRKREYQRGNLGGTKLGPYQSGYRVKEVLRIARKIFRWCSHPPNVRPTARPCFYFHLGECSGACVGRVTPAEYSHMIAGLKLFLRGKTSEVTSILETELKTAIRAEAFERAATLRDQLQLIKTVTSESYRLQPNLLLLPQLSATKSRDGILFLSKLLKEYLAVPLAHELKTIEGYDVSNIHGTTAAVAVVSFTHGSPDSSKYRLFNIRTLNTPNDYGMLKEALSRRLSHPEWGKPDLVVIDGGKGQLRAALRTWKWRTPIISIAKRPDRIIIPMLEFQKKEVGKPFETKKLKYHILKLPELHPALRLIQQIRDEAHRFSKKQHVRRRTKALVSV